MSFRISDYIPCDLTRYSQQILPTWRAAQSGNLQPLRKLMASADHFSFWSLFNIPNPLPDTFFAGPRSYFDYNFFNKDKNIWPQLLSPRNLRSSLRDILLQDAEGTRELDIWALFSRHLPAFFENNAHTESQHFLLRCLFYTFCCQLPDEAMADSRELIEEGVYLWEEYMARSSQVQALWAPFSQPAPQPLADQLLAPKTYQDYLASALHPDAFPRAMFPHDPNIFSFLDHEETARLVTYLPTKERPDLDGIVDGCVRDRDNEKWSLPPDLEQLLDRTRYHVWQDVEQLDKEQTLEVYRKLCAYWNEHHPLEFQRNVDRYYQWLHRTEAKMLARFRYAAERGWGMIKICV